MISEKVIISGVGCAIADLIYNGVSFDSPGFKNHLSKRIGDGGLSPGKLVFTEELEAFSGKPYPEILSDLVGNRGYDVLNVGGPALVSMILASQILNGADYEVRFFGMAGDDAYAEEIFKMVRQTPLDIRNYLSSKGKVTPFTDVFSDPSFDNGHGERTFVNNIGAAWDYSPDHISKEFYQSHIACFGGTALVPQIHDNLTDLLKKAKENKCITVVNTVYDFRNQELNPEAPWPLVKCIEDYQLIDILIMDCEEALKISGQKSMEDAAAFFSATQISSFLITNGAKDLLAYSNGTLFKKNSILSFPISNLVSEQLRNHPELRGDTTGCGDNFAGGVISSLAMQIKNNNTGNFSLTDAISWGVSAGGNSCFTIGGTCIERIPGEQKQKIQSIKREFLIQIGHL